VVVHNFNVFRAICAPDETDPILPIDSDAVLAFPVAVQRLKPIAWRGTQIRKIDGSLKHGQLSFSHRRYRCPAPASAGFKKSSGVGASEASYHIVTLNVIR